MKKNAIPLTLLSLAIAAVPVFLFFAAAPEASAHDEQYVSQGNPPITAGWRQDVPQGYGLTGIGYGSDDKNCFIYIKSAPVNADGTLGSVTGWYNFSCPTGGGSQRMAAEVYGHYTVGWTYGSDTSGGMPGNDSTPANECYYQEYAPLTNINSRSGWYSANNGTCDDEGYQESWLKGVVRAYSGHVIVAVGLSLGNDGNVNMVEMNTRHAYPRCSIGSFTCDSNSQLSWSTSNCSNVSISNIGAVGTSGSTAGSCQTSYTLTADSQTSIATCSSPCGPTTCTGQGGTQFSPGQTETVGSGVCAASRTCMAGPPPFWNPASLNFPGSSTTCGSQGSCVQSGTSCQGNASTPVCNSAGSCSGSTSSSCTVANGTSCNPPQTGLAPATCQAGTCTGTGAPPTPWGTISTPASCTAPCNINISFNSGNVYNRPSGGPIVNVWRNGTFKGNYTGNTTGSDTEWNAGVGTYQFCLRANKEDWSQTGNLACSTTVVTNGVTPTNGTCGSSHNSSFSSAPTSGLCNSGSASGVSGSGPWSWTCYGSNGGTSANCSASKSIIGTNGTCGSSNGGTFPSAPTTGLCNYTSSSPFVSGSGPWTWTCYGSSGGGNASCSASRTATCNSGYNFGNCGAAGGCLAGQRAMVFWSSPFGCTYGSNYCVADASCGGGASDLRATLALTDAAGTVKTAFSPGERIYPRVTIINNSANPTTSTQGFFYISIYANRTFSPPINTASDVNVWVYEPGSIPGYGTKTYSVTTNSAYWSNNGQTANYFTKASNGSYTAYAYVDSFGYVNETNESNNAASASYTVGPPPPTNGTCGSSNGGTFASAPTTNLCNYTSATPTVSGSGPWSWTCYGASGGSNASCGANKTDQAPVGWLDAADCNALQGWTVDMDTPSNSMAVHVYRDNPYPTGTFVGSYNTDVYRGDVNSAFGISGNHGYYIPTPAAFKDGVAHNVYIYGINTSGTGPNPLLSGVPRSITCVSAPPAPDLKVTVWASWAGTGRDTPWGYNGSDGPATAYAGAPYALSWGSVANATSCTLDGAGAAVTGGTINTYAANALSSTHTLTCAGPGGTRSDVVTVNLPPTPTRVGESCAGTAGSFSWNKSPGYALNYVRLCKNGASGCVMDQGSINNGDTENFPGSTATFNAEPGATYSWWVHTKDPGNGAWGHTASGAIACPLPAKPTISLTPLTTFYGFKNIYQQWNPAPQTLTISNTGTATLNWTGSTNQAWCRLSAASGSVAAGGSANVTVSMDAPSASNPGVFPCTITITDPNATNPGQTVAVNYSVTTCNNSRPSGDTIYSGTNTRAALVDVWNSSVVQFPTWSNVNGQDDLIWYPSANVGGNTFQATIDLARHRMGNPDYGQFYTHVYAFYSPTAAGFCGSADFSRSNCVSTTGQPCNDGNACTSGETVQCAGTCGGGAVVPGTHSECSGNACGSAANTASACSNSCTANNQCGTCDTLTYRPGTSGFSAIPTGAVSSTLSITSGQTFYVQVDYGRMTDAIKVPTVSPPDFACAWAGSWNGTAAVFSCAAAGNGTHTISSGTNSGTSDDICATTQTVGNVSGLTVTPSTGTINVNYTLDGVAASGASINYSISGPTNVAGASRTFSAGTVSHTSLNPGAYTLTYNSGGPAGSIPKATGFITPGNSQNLAAGSVLGFTINFVSTPPSAPSEAHAYNSGNDPLPSGSPGRARCEQIRLTWTDNSNDETGFKIYQDGVEVATAPANATSRILPVANSAASYSYSVAADRSGNSSSRINASENPIPSIACAANLGDSDKDIMAVNGLSFTPSKCGGTDAAPITTVKFKGKDVIRFSINVCNTQGELSATEITIRDTLTSMVLPTKTNTWNASYNGIAIPDAAIGISGTAPNQTLTFTLTNASYDVPAGEIRSLEFEAEIAPGYPRFQNSASISYRRNATGFTTKTTSTPLIPYMSGGTPEVTETK